MTLVIKRENSPNCGPRKNGLTPIFLILHYTEIDEAETHARFIAPHPSDVSSHYVVATDGRVMQYVDENMRAWHAGASYWNGVTDINSASIGIEIVNAGAPAGYPPFPSAQMEMVTELCRDICARHGIKPAHVLGHSDIAPDRKLDPGPAFDWEMLEQNGIGMMPVDDGGAMPDLAAVDACLTAIGYNPNVDLTLRLRSFAAHYDRTNWTADGEISPVTLRKTRVLAGMIKR